MLVIVVSYAAMASVAAACVLLTRDPPPRPVPDAAVVVPPERAVDPDVGNTSNSAMVIVEPRRHPHLPYVLRNFDANVPPHYDLYVFHGASHAEFARQCVRGLRRRAVLVPLDVDTMGADGYNALLKSRALWDAIDAEHVLVFQSDAVLCSKSKETLKNFEHLGYVGCAYDARAGRGTHWKPHAFWGVGGLSFHRKSAVLTCLARSQHPPWFAEDVFFSDCVDEGVGQRPQPADLPRFCSQNTFLAQSFGAHKVHAMMRPRDKARFLEYCPEAKALQHETWAPEDAHLAA